MKLAREIRFSVSLLHEFLTVDIVDLTGLKTLRIMEDEVWGEVGLGKCM